MGAESWDAVMLLAVFVATGLTVAATLLMASGVIAGLLALTRGQTANGYWRECVVCLPRGIAIVSAVGAASVVVIAVLFHR